MNKLILVLSCLVLLATSCKTLGISQTSQTQTTQQVSLGSIGLDKASLLQKEYKTTALPTYKEPIKVTASIHNFTKASYKAFLKANELQPTNLEIKVLDSAVIKPVYIQLHIADKLAIIKTLNNTDNTEVKSYLKNNAHTNILSSVSIALNQKQLELIKNADAIFLVESSPKTYALQLHNDGERTDLIKFNDGIIFGYKTSHCCWQENKRRNVDIVDLVEKNSSCPNSTYRSGLKAEKKINQIKF